MMAAWGQAVRRGTLLALLVVLTSCGPTARSYDMGDGAIRYDSVPELVATTAAVVVGWVDEAVREPTVRHVDIGQTPLRVRVAVERRLRISHERCSERFYALAMLARCGNPVQGAPAATMVSPSGMLAVLVDRSLQQAPSL